MNPRSYLCSVCFQPFSNGLVTVMVPQLRRENSLLLWSTLDLNSPVHAFVGHDDVVLEFQWRPQKEGDQSHAEIQEFGTRSRILPNLLLVSEALKKERQKTNMLLRPV